MASKERLGGDGAHIIPEMEDHSISIKTRRTILLFLAIVGCTAVLVLSVQNAQERFDIDGFGLIDGDESEAVGRSPVVLEQQSSALATALRRLKKNKGKKYCDHACEVKKKRIKAAIARKMKQLRDQINSDFSSMIDFGHKAGYLPPPKSIKEQVMSGTLLKGDGKTGADAVAPPPFKVDPKLTIPAIAVADDSSDGDSHSRARGHSHRKGRSRRDDDSDSRSSGRHSDKESASSDRGERKASAHRHEGGRRDSRRESARSSHHVKQGERSSSSSSSSDASDDSSDDSSSSDQPSSGGHTRLSSDDSTDDSSSSDSSSDDSSDSSGDSSSDSSSSGGGGGGGSSSSSSSSGSAWAKAFSFMKHTDNPIGGSATSGSASASHSRHAARSSSSGGTSFVGVTTFKHVAKGDKFLENFEDPSAAASSSSSSSSSDSGASSSSSGGGGGKGKDLLKSAETDKFLAGFLGGA